MTKRVILFQDRDLSIDPVQLAHITKLHNDGIHYKEIAEKFNRAQIEIILCLLHQANEKKVNIRQFAEII